MVNRESVPLILALLVPFVLLGVILLYFYGYDLTLFFRKIPLVYYIAIIPILLGFTVIIAKYARSE